MSDTVQRAPQVAGSPPNEPASGGRSWNWLKRGGLVMAEQREATVLVVVVLLMVYFRFFSSASSNFLTSDNIANITWTVTPWAIIAIGEVFLLVCGELDLSVGFVLGFSPFLMHYLIDFYGVPPVVAVLLSMLMGVIVGFANGFLTVTLGVPSFITTLGTGFALQGIMLVTSHAYPATIPASASGVGKFLGSSTWAEITWTVILVAIFQIVLSRTRWGLHTVAVGGNILGASEAGIRVPRIKYGNFMITGFMGALVGLLVTFQTSSIDPSNASYQPMFYAIAGAVIGGTALAGGSGTIIGAFLGTLVLAILYDGFNLIGISANPQPIILGGAILVAMIANVQLARLRRAGRA
ncbi:MAG TPA: ABC transporter permease [Streptosporangiaceae bacterium]|nr:ABC transporter permease [Streptosporangiaceae bacterium]